MRFIRPLILLLIFSLGIVNASGASATGSTQVMATLCSAATTATLAITSPANQSTIMTTPLTLSGTVTQISQIRVFIDSVYTETIPLNAGATSYSFPLRLEVGAHTIRLEGVDICGATSPVAELHLVYEPSAEIADGVAGTSEELGAASSKVSQPDQSETPPAPLSSDMSSQPISQLLSSFGNALRSVTGFALGALDIAHEASSEEISKQTARFALIAGGAGAVLFASSVSSVVLAGASKISASSAHFLAEVGASRLRLGARIVGTLLALLGLLV